MKILIKLLFVIVFPLQFIYSQPLDSLWMHYYSGFRANDIIQKYDSGYFVVGSSGGNGDSPHIASISKDGQLLWDKQFPTPDYIYDRFRNIITSSDSNYLVGGGYNGLAWLLKMNGEGDTLWTKSFGESFGMITSMEELPNKDLIITGYPANYSEDFYLMKTNQYGDTIWSHKYIFEDPFHWVTSQCVKQTSDSGYIISAYYSGGYGGSYLIIVKTDSNGDTLWTKDSMYELDVHYGYFPEILIDHDTIYFFGEGSLQNGEGVNVIKLKPEGFEYWLIKEYNNGSGPFCTGTFTNSGTIMLAAELYSNNQYRIGTIEIDKNGNILWEKILGDYGVSYDTRQIVETFDNGYIISGNDYRAFLLKIGEKPSAVKNIKTPNLNGFVVSPNPVTTNTTVDFKIFEKDFYTISVFDLKGNKIKILVEKELAPGSYKYPLSPGDLSNGVYMISLKSGSFQNTQKIVISR